MLSIYESYKLETLSTNLTKVLSLPLYLTNLIIALVDEPPSVNYLGKPLRASRVLIFPKKTFDAPSCRSIQIKIYFLNPVLSYLLMGQKA